MNKTNKNPHDGHRQRVKEKALKAGIEHWPAHEIMELLLMYAIPVKDVNPIAHDLIDSFGSISGVLDAGFEQLKKIKGIGKEAALFLSILPDILLKYTASKNVDEIVLDTPYKCVNHFRSIDRVRRFEGFYVFCMNAKHKLLKTIKFNSELPSAINVPLTTFAEKILFSANKSIIIMHSHPGGDSNPTQADCVATKRIMTLIASFGVTLFDHIIVTDNDYFSFRTNGMIDTLYKDILPSLQIGFREYNTVLRQLEKEKNKNHE